MAGAAGREIAVAVLAGHRIAGCRDGQWRRAAEFVLPPEPGEPHIEVVLAGGGSEERRDQARDQAKVGDGSGDPERDLLSGAAGAGRERAAHGSDPAEQRS